MKKFQIAIIFIFLSFIVYFVSSQKTYQHLHYFVPLADSLLHGRLDVSPNSALNELVPREGRFYVVYPPMPAVVLVPFVAVFGGDFNQKWASIIVASITIGLFYLLVTKFTKKTWVQIFLTILLAFGTNFYFTALAGTSWYFAHICAVFFVTASLLSAKNKKPFQSGILLGGAFLSRLPTILTFPAAVYLLLQESEKKERLKILTNFFIALFCAIIIFGLYNYFRFGSLTETGYSLIPGILEESWFSKGVFDLSYIGRNIEAAFASFPTISTRFPYFVPKSYAMAIYLSSPALMLLLVAKIKEGWVKVLLLSVLLASIPGFMHSTVGFTQFGYRFSLDYIVLMLLVLATGLERVGWKISLVFLLLSLMVNFYVVYLYTIGLFSY